MIVSILWLEFMNRLIMHCGCHSSSESMLLRGKLRLFWYVLNNKKLHPKRSVIMQRQQLVLPSITYFHPTTYPLQGFLQLSMILICYSSPYPKHPSVHHILRPFFHNPFLQKVSIDHPNAKRWLIKHKVHVRTTR